MQYYTADLHFFHPELCKARGFAALEEMNESIVKNLSFLTEKDTLYILGDVAYGYTMDKDLDDIVSLLDRIRCTKHLITGNHDAWQLKNNPDIWKFKMRFASINDSLLIRDSGYDLFLSHYPMLEWDGFYKGRWLFHGHIHEKAAAGPGLLLELLPTAVNIGYDLTGGARTAEQLIEERKKTWKMPDFSFRDAVIPRMDPSLLNGKKGIIKTLSEFDALKDVL